MKTPGKTLVSIDFHEVSQENAKVSVFDRGFLFGDSVYEVVRTYNFKPLALGRHYQRLVRSAEAIGFALPFDLARLKNHLDELGRRLGEGDCFFRVIVTRGAYDVSLYPPEEVKTTTVAMLGKLPPWPASHYEEGIFLKTVGIHRNARGALNPMIKSGNYLNNLLAAMEARGAGAVDAVILNSAGQVTESSTANIFMVDKGVLLTPPEEAGILDGVSRRVVMELAAEEGIPCEARLFGQEALHGADECFLTSTTREVMPVSQVDDQHLASPGPLTLRLMSLYRDYVDRTL